MWYVHTSVEDSGGESQFMDIQVCKCVVILYYIWLDAKRHEEFKNSGIISIHSMKHAEVINVQQTELILTIVQTLSN